LGLGGLYRIAFLAIQNTSDFSATGYGLIVDGVTTNTVSAEPPLAATPNSLWPPNNKMVPVTVGIAKANEHWNLTCKIIGVNSNEPVDKGDVVLTGDLTLNLRATRLGVGVGRVYSITVRCTDPKGVYVDLTVTVTVPHG
jgi:hypothetical protein